MVSQQIVDIIIKAEDQASAAADKVDESLQKIGKSGGLLSKIPGFDTLRTKISSVSSAISGKFSSAVEGARTKLSQLAKGAEGAGSAMNFLKSAASMAVGMIGYDLVNSIMETTRASLNARSGIQAFAQRLNMSSSEVSAFQKSLDDLQNTYRKIDMDVVGQQATDMAYRLGLPKTSLAELTETTAIFTDAMQRNGRSAEDSMLAMSDAMDGQFTRLKEIGISQEDLMKNGWSGDLNDKTGLLTAMNKALKDQHYDDLAKSVDTLDDAWQVLSITLSNLLEAIILPLTPAIVAIVNGFTDAIDAIKPFVQSLMDAAGALPDWLKDAAWAAGLALALYYIGTVIMGTVVPALAAAALAALDFAIAMLANPWTYVLVALVAIAYAIYEVGKSFGWWDDVQGMLAAIWSGIQRLWDAFINHPDVQAAIKSIQDAWKSLNDQLKPIIDWLKGIWDEIFPESAKGKFDIVHTIIMALGEAWNYLRIPMGLVVDGIKILWDAFSGVYEECLLPFAEWLSEAFAFAFELIGEVIMEIMPYVQRLSEAFSLFANGQMSLPDLIGTVMSLLWGIYTTILSMIVNAVVNWASQMLSRAVSAASNFVNGIVQWISQLPGRVASYMSSALSRIISIASQWVSSAVSKASSLVSQVASTLSGLPGRISSALSGVVSAIVRPFQEAYNRVAEEVDKIKSKASEITGIAFGGETAYAGEGLLTSDYSIGESSISVDVNEHITLDLVNVPAHIDTQTLINMLSDRNVLRALTGNRTFQDLDSQVKSEILRKSLRANGG